MATGTTWVANARTAFALAVLVALAAPLIVGPAAAATTTTYPPGFQESVVFSGLNQPTAVRFSPDGRVFVAEQGGLIKVFDGLSDPTPSIYADLRTNVMAYDDRGLLGMALDPNFPSTPNIYVAYSYDAPIGGTAPTWGTAGADSDDCPTPTTDGCVIGGRLSMLSPGSSGSTTYRDAVLADSPSGYWRLGEATGTTVSDASGQNHPGSYLNTPSLGQPGALAADADTSVAFNGTDEYTSVPYSAALNPSQFTVEAWVYVTGGQGTFRSVVTSRDTPNNPRGYILYAGNDNTWQFWVGNGSGWNAAYGGSPVVLNTWAHLVGTYDGTAARLYVNGSLVSSSGAAGYVSNVQRPLRIAAGATDSTPQFYLPGRVDEVAVYGSALSATRIAAHYAAATASGGGSGVVEHVLIEDWCQQFTTGAPGGLAFGADGALYMAAGAGAGYGFIDYGEKGNPPNPCGDPPGGVGALLTPPTAEGGSLRSQDMRTSGDPLGLGGTLIRVDPATGAGLPSNPMGSSGDANARRILAYGFRNPFRMAIRPGTNEVWMGDVGGGNYEEIDRVSSGGTSVVNFGWPCYEGPNRNPGFDAPDFTICENLYAQAGAVTAPYYAYIHGSKIVPSETCSPTDGSAISGLAFNPANSAYPSSYNGALFFADYARQCIWVMYAGTNGLPDPSTIQPFAQGASFPVDLQFGPDGRLYYVDVGTGTIRRIDYTSGNQPPTARATASPTSGAVPLVVSFDGSGSSDPDGTITYAWDLDGDGQFDDSTAVKPTFQYTTPGTYTVRLRVTDNQGATNVSNPLTIVAGSSPPTAIIDSPAASLTWQVGDVISFSGHGTDPEDGNLPASALRWNVTLQHCITPGNCHTHNVQSFTGVSSGSFAAPDHPYPSFLQLTLTVTDSSGLSSSQTIDLQPRTVTAQMVTSPPGLSLVVNDGASTVAPFTATLIEGATTTLSAPTPQVLNGTTYVFSGWSDGGAQTHNIIANSSGTYTATYTAQTSPGYSAAVLADSPRSYWRLGETSGTTAADASGQNHPGSYVNTPSLGQPGAIAGDSNTSVAFNGTNEYTSVPYSAALNPSQFTVEAWVYVTGGQGTFRSVVTSRDTPNKPRGYILYAGNDNTWQFWVGNGTSWNAAYGGSPVVLNRWTHLVGTYDGTAARLYVNGSLVSSSGAAGYVQNAQRPLRIAAGATDSPKPQFYLPGRVDEAAVYGSALSATRIAAHYAAAGSGPSNQPPTAAATASPSSGAVPLTVNFNGSGSSDPDGTIASYAWDLDGDGQFDDSTAVAPSFPYTTAGTYTVRLQVTDNQGATAVSPPITITANAAGNQQPTAVATASPTSGAVPLTVNFNGSGSSDPDGTIASYAWDLDGDGQFDDSTAVAPSFPYTTAGTYTVRLQVTDNQGATAVSPPITITANAAGNQQPTAVATASPTSGAVPLTVNFNGSGSSDPDGTIASYAWDLDGDGQFDDSTAVAPSFPYTTAGTYTVRLQVTDNQGATAVSPPITISAGSSPPPGYSATVLADSPSGYWRLGEATGTTVSDASGQNHPGSYLNTPSLGQPGALAADADTSVAFNGTDEYTSVPYSAALNPSQFTVEAWVYVTGGQGTFRSVVTSRDTPNNPRGYILYAGNDNTWQFWVGNGSGWNAAYGGSPVVLNTWAHLVGTYDGTAARLYVNGSLVSSSGAAGYVSNVQRPLRIAAGATDSTPQFYLPGRVDEVAVYGSALSATRIAAHYAAASTVAARAISASGVVEHGLTDDWWQQFMSGAPMISSARLPYMWGLDREG